MEKKTVFELVPIGDQLPNNGDYVIIVTGDGNREARFVGGKFEIQIDGEWERINFTHYIMTHWLRKRKIPDLDKLIEKYEKSLLFYRKEYELSNKQDTYLIQEFKLKCDFFESIIKDLKGE